MIHPAHRLERILRVIAIAIIVLIPFHAFLSVWGASVFGHYTLLRLWKEFLLAVLAVGGVLLAVPCLKHPSRVLSAVRSRPLVWLILAYLTAVTVAAAITFIAHGTTTKAIAYGWLLDTRYLVFFLVVWWLSVGSGSWAVRWRRIVLVPAVIVIVLGLLQLILPADILKHFGYGPQTIPVLETVDQKAGYQRLTSTLRGANPLGAYLVVVLTALAAMFLRNRRPRARYTYGVLGAAGLAVLGLTYSRSAWLGLAAVLVCGTWVTRKSVRLRRLIPVVGAILILLIAGAGYALRDNDVFQNTVFHTDEHSRSVMSSNQGHFGAMREGLKDVIAEPLGAGVGTAGPASAYGNRPPRIAENYFIQIGQETGLIGLALYIAATVVLACQLYIRRANTLALVLLASLAGLTIVNMLSHAWTDDTLAYMWWGLAGLACGSIKPGSRDIAEPHN